LLCDKAGSKAALRQRGLSENLSVLFAGPQDKASPLHNWLIYELQPARFFSLLQEARLRNNWTAYETNVFVLYKTCQEQYHISNKNVMIQIIAKMRVFCMRVSQTGL
jgi:hypothetical protein